MHTHMQTCVLYTHVNMLTYANTYAYIQIHIYIYTHTHMHIHLEKCALTYISRCDQRRVGAESLTQG